MEEFLKNLKTIRKEIREAYKGYKVSVQQGRGGYTPVIHIHIDGCNYEELEAARKIVKKFQDPGETDIMTDYFDYNFYYTINGQL